jgi:uncharacterized membrane protein YbaN (DUF454 family)
LRVSGPEHPDRPAAQSGPETGGEPGAPRARAARATDLPAGRLRHLWTATGLASFGIGAVGAFLPLLPTVPFMLLAAFCLARGSERFHRWLVDHPRFGAAIRDWQVHGAVSRRGKRAAVIAIAASFLIALLAGLPRHVLLIQAAVLAGVLAFILTRPEGPRG